jgi:hypothetical protein
MKTLRFFPLLALLIIIPSLNLNAQCKAFAKKTCLPELGSYTHDGNYHAAVLSEGEEAELFKTFYSDMEYRLSLCAEETIPSVEFMVYDSNRNLIYSSKESNYARTWDFKLESSQQLRIVIRVNTSSSQGVTPASGCVSIMFGFKLKS